MLSLGSRAWMMRRPKKMRSASLRVRLTNLNLLRFAYGADVSKQIPADGMDRASSGQSTQSAKLAIARRNRDIGSHPNILQGAG
jgi:hypothetical protein